MMPRNSANIPNAATASTSSQQSTEANERSAMRDRIRPAHDRIEYQRVLPVDDRLAAMLGVKANTAHQVLYGERGNRAVALLIVAAFRASGRDPRAYYAPLLAALDDEHEASLARKIEADARENIAMAHYLENGSPAVRRAFVLALEQEASEALALAAKLRSEGDDEE